MSISIWSTHLNKQIIVKGSIDEWVDANMEAEEEIAKLKAEADQRQRLIGELTADVLRFAEKSERYRKENEKLRSSLDAIKRLLDSGFVP